MNINPQQRDAARRRANEHRSGVAAIKAELRALPTATGAQRAARSLRDPCEYVAGTTLRKLLGAVNQRGLEWQRLAYASAGIPNPDRKIRDLTDRQRHAMADLLPLGLAQLRQTQRAAVDLGVAPFQLPRRLESEHVTAAIRALAPYVASPVVAAAARAALEAAAAVPARNELRPAEVGGP